MIAMVPGGNQANPITLKPNSTVTGTPATDLPSFPGHRSPTHGGVLTLGETLAPNRSSFPPGAQGLRVSPSPTHGGVLTLGETLAPNTSPFPPGAQGLTVRPTPPVIVRKVVPPVLPPTPAPTPTHTPPPVPVGMMAPADVGMANASWLNRTSTFSSYSVDEAEIYFNTLLRQVGKRPGDGLSRQDLNTLSQRWFGDPKLDQFIKDLKDANNFNEITDGSALMTWEQLFEERDDAGDEFNITFYTRKTGTPTPAPTPAPTPSPTPTPTPTPSGYVDLGAQFANRTDKQMNTVPAQLALTAMKLLELLARSQGGVTRQFLSNIQSLMTMINPILGTLVKGLEQNFDEIDTNRSGTLTEFEVQNQLPDDGNVNNLTFYTHSGSGGGWVMGLPRRD